MTSALDWVGLGAMGRPAAAALAGAGTRVIGHDAHPAPDLADWAGSAGVDLVDSLDALSSDVVVLSLPTPAIVLDVVVALAREGRTILDTSTVGPDTSTAAAELARAAGGEYADTPVLGRPGAVGAWTIPVGGSAEVHALAEEVLAPLAKAVPQVGGTGSAATIKVLNNLMLGAINAITAEVLVLAAARGLDPGVFVDTVLDSGAASVSGLFKDVAPRAISGDYAPVFSLELMAKDTDLALAMAADTSVPMHVGAAVQALNAEGVAAGLGAEDSIALVQLLERLSGVRARRHDHE